MKTEDLVHCLAKTETNDMPVILLPRGLGEASLLGDGGRAIGRWQLHPDWMHTQEVRFGLQPKLNERHDDYHYRLVFAFVDHYLGTMDDLGVAMYFHLGHRALPTDADWDQKYAERFQTFAADVAHP